MIVERCPCGVAANVGFDLAKSVVDDFDLGQFGRDMVVAVVRPSFVDFATFKNPRSTSAINVDAIYREVVCSTMSAGTRLL